MDDLKPQEEQVEPAVPQKGVYGPNDKPKGMATVVPDEMPEIFPVDNGDVA